MTVGVFLFALSFELYIFYIEDPVNSKWILFTAGMIGDYSGLSTLYIYIYKLHVTLVVNKIGKA